MKKFFKKYPLVTPEAFVKDVKKFHAWDWASKSWVVTVAAVLAVHFTWSPAAHHAAHVVACLFGFATSIYFGRWAMTRFKKTKMQYELGFVALLCGFLFGFTVVSGTFAAKHHLHASAGMKNRAHHGSFERRPASMQIRGMYR